MTELPAVPIFRALLATAAGVLALAGAAPAAAQVGYTQTTLAGLPVTLVYPTAEKARRHAFGAFEIEVAVDAPVAPAASGRRRLVVTSHGTAGSPLPDHGIAAALARAGFVVAQPLHAGDNFRDASKAGPEAWQTRPGEVTRLVDALAAHPQWGPLLQLDRVGVHGTSAGGATVLALAGAQWNTLALVRHCQAHLEEDIGFCFNGAGDDAARERRRASFERARGVPEVFLPADLKAWRGGRSPQTAAADAGTPFDARPDARIASVTAAVPVGAIFSAASLARVRVPVGIVAARDDDMLLPRFHSDLVLRHCRACVSLADLEGATHFDVMHPWPAEVNEAVRAQQTRGVRTNPAFDRRLREEAYARVAAFHRRHLAGE